jgi:SAM-dependent methyltransferase
MDFRVGDIAATDLDEGRAYDLVNVANVLFHLVEPQLFLNAIKNIARLLAPGGIAVTTEYLPTTTLRTNMMLVHSRDDFKRVVAEAGLEILKIKAFSFFSNDPMGLDISEADARTHFNQVRADMDHLLSSSRDDETRQWLTNLFITMEKGLLEFSRRRIPDIDLPSQKLVALRRLRL